MKTVDLEHLYLRCPVWMQKIIVNIEGWRNNNLKFGKGYERINNKVLERYHLDSDQLLKYQESRLRDLFIIASTSEFWKRQFNKFNVQLDSRDIFSEIKKLPIISKKEAKEHNAEIHTKAIQGNKTFRVSTSGTTGGGLSFLRTIDGYREQWATWWRYWGWHGINKNDLCANFSGRSVIHDIRCNKPPFWRMNHPGNQIHFSVYHIKPETTECYIEALRRFNVKWILGTPSIISLLASHILDQNLALPESLNAVALGAENLFPHQLDTIKSAFCVIVCQHYGLGESVANFSQCKDGNLHVDEDFSYVEFVPLEGSEGLYKIVGTGWVNPAFPLIRYDTGDIVPEPLEKCACGRKGRIISQINGRVQDYIILKDGRHIARLNFLFRDLTNIREAQLYQKVPGAVVIRVVKGDKYDENDEEAKLMKYAKLRLGKDMDIKIQYTDKIEKTKAGKLRFVVSEIEPALK